MRVDMQWHSLFCAMVLLEHSAGILPMFSVCVFVRHRFQKKKLRTNPTFVCPPPNCPCTLLKYMHDSRRVKPLTLSLQETSYIKTDLYTAGEAWKAVFKEAETL